MEAEIGEGKKVAMGVGGVDGQIKGDVQEHAGGKKDYGWPLFIEGEGEEGGDEGDGIKEIDEILPVGFKIFDVPNDFPGSEADEAFPDRQDEDGQIRQEGAPDDGGIALFAGAA